MSMYVNPFYARASEQLGDVRSFVQTFGAGALDMLPEQLWDRLVIVRSTRGAGKTSLMRAFAADSLDWMRRNIKPTEPVFAQLQSRGVLDAHRINKLGVILSLDRDYRSLLDLSLPDEVGRRLFLKLLDVRVFTAVIRAALLVSGRQYPDDADQFALAGTPDDPKTEATIARIGGPNGGGLIEYATHTEREILGLLDTLLTTGVESSIEGHNELYCLDLLSADLSVAGRPLATQPLLMFDDGHRLAPAQRDVLLDQLRKRNTRVARWYAERFEALSDQELLSGVGEVGRDHVLVDLDHIARQGSHDNRRFQRGRHDRVLEDIARRRAAQTLLTYAQERQDFLSLLADDRDTVLDDREEMIISTIHERAVLAAGGDSRYEAWIDDASRRRGWDAAVRWRELEILIRRERDRQPELFSAVLEREDADTRSSGALREGAAVALAREFNLPYYGGASTIVRLASHNVEQFLNLCGDLFAEMLVDISLGRQPQLLLRRQHRVIREASERFWESIPKTVPHGRDVQALVGEVVRIAQIERDKPTLPYPPGVTGTAMLMAERAQLLDPDFRERTPGAQRLFGALASAVAHNVITAELDYSVKGNRYMVLYLNRLLCPRFWLPLGLGSFRERRLQTMIGWMQHLPSHGASTEVPDRLPV